MIENYKILSNGVIQQTKFFNKIINYDIKYIDDRYNSYGDKGLQMSFLRLGYLLGVINKTPNSILDIGYGNGDFLKICKTVINSCYGNDITNYPLPNNVEFIENFTDKYFEVISMFDVLEHFEDISFISKLNCKYIIVSVPWCHYLNDEWFLEWKHRRPDEHLWHFNDESLSNLFKENGYKLISKSNIEDSIRKPTNGLSNILTCVFEKIN